MIRHRHFLIVLLFILTSSIGAQSQYPKDYFVPPVDFQLNLSGTFAELRANHFHSGIDIRTNGEKASRFLPARKATLHALKFQPLDSEKHFILTIPMVILLFMRM